MDRSNSWTQKNYEAECAKGGDSVFRDEGPALEEEESGLVDAVGETDERILRKRLWNGDKEPRKDGQVLYGRESNYIKHVKEVAILMTEIQISFYFYAKTVLSIRSYGNTYKNA
ncbi:unnamed protein product, partial [Brenthis ino]